MSWVRTWLPAAIIVSGVVLAALMHNAGGLDGGVLLVSAGMSVWLLNWFYRLGVRGDEERDAEDAARVFFDTHGYWPDEAPAGQARTEAPAGQARTDQVPGAGLEPARPRGTKAFEASASTDSATRAGAQDAA